MTYSPLNKTVYTAAYAGALAGIAASQKTPTDEVPTDPPLVGSSDIAGAWAQELDTQWAGASSSTLDVLAIEDCHRLSRRDRRRRLRRRLRLRL